MEEKSQAMVLGYGVTADGSCSEMALWESPGGQIGQARKKHVNAMEDKR